MRCPRSLLLPIESNHRVDVPLSNGSVPTLLIPLPGRRIDVLAVFQNGVRLAVMALRSLLASSSAHAWHYWYYKIGKQRKRRRICRRLWNSRNREYSNRRMAPFWARSLVLCILYKVLKVSGDGGSFQQTGLPPEIPYKRKLAGNIFNFGTISRARASSRCLSVESFPKFTKALPAN